MFVAGLAIIESDSRVLITHEVTTIREPQETMREPQPSCTDEATTRLSPRIIVRDPAISCCGDPARCGAPHMPILPCITQTPHRRLASYGTAAGSVQRPG
jgi:hypothetical protein